jgi:hypothetical protein
VKFRLGIILLLIFMSPTVAQSGTGTDYEAWSDITTIYNISERWRYIGDQGIRRETSGSDFTLLYFRPSVRYWIKPGVTLLGGIRFFKTFSDKDREGSEIGPWQGFRFTWPILGNSEYAVSHYLRLEERMIWLSNTESEFDFFPRARYQLGISSPVYDMPFKNGVFLTGSVEFFWDLNDKFTDNFLNQIRYDVGAGTHVSDTWQVELHYLLHWRKIDSDAPFADEEHILRLRFFYTFN